MSTLDFAINNQFLKASHTQFQPFLNANLIAATVNLFTLVSFGHRLQSVVHIYHLVMVSIRFVLITVIIARSDASMGDFEMPKYGNALTRATVEIIERFYLDETNTLNIYHASKENEDLKKETNLDIINEILYQLKSKFVVQLEGYLDFKVTSHKRVHNILFIDSFESFYNIFRLMSPFYFSYQGHYLIILTTYSDSQYQIMLEIFEELWAQYIINVNIIWLAPENDDEAMVYTYYPYTSFSCGKAIPIQLNQFRFGQWLHNHSSFFPDKVKNLHGCPLTVATVRSAPFMMIYESDNGGVLTDGIDGVLLRVLSQRMNFSIVLLVMESQGSVQRNGSHSGTFGKVINSEANMTIGYISTTVFRNLYMTSSYIYHTSNLIWITPPGRRFTSIEKLLKPFRKVLWFCILTVFFLSFIAIRLVKNQKMSSQNFVFGPGNTSPLLNIANVFFGGSLSKLPSRNFARTLLAFFMIYCLIIRSSYTGELGEYF